MLHRLHFVTTTLRWGQEDCKEQPVYVSDVSLTRAFQKMVKPDDNAENFYDKVLFSLS